MRRLVRACRHGHMDSGIVVFNGVRYGISSSRSGKYERIIGLESKDSIFLIVYMIVVGFRAPASIVE